MAALPQGATFFSPLSISPLIRDQCGQPDPIAAQNILPVQPHALARSPVCLFLTSASTRQTTNRQQALHFATSAPALLLHRIVTCKPLAAVIAIILCYDDAPYNTPRLALTFLPHLVNHLRYHLVRAVKHRVSFSNTASHPLCLSPVKHPARLAAL